MNTKAIVSKINITVGVAIGYGIDWRGSNPDWDIQLWLLQNCLNRLSGPPSLLLNVYRW
jgi:hypothetical protein